MAGRFKRLRGLLPLAGVLALTAAVLWALGIRINLSASYPVGLYRALPDGRLAVVCLSGNAAQLAGERGYVQRGTCPLRLAPVMKKIVAAAGDEVEVTSAGVRINGRLLVNSAPRVKDSQQRPMPSLANGGVYRRRLEGKEIWLASEHHPGSFDSRYIGPVLLGQVRERLEPLWIASSISP